ncbi:TetR/AcrR family transcriptional regulator [Guptibacillus hwajinpoensis]|uniref:TetR/AcrR family transcriptional regulator n=1 Tax=Guptibacillus hwajinpoensis TaxID=208199 RepID=UPI0024B32F2A|nr:TetR-like C-terminal domain-containing protein [Pseudalkalibacillus hwajinpoensis]
MKITKDIVIQEALAIAERENVSKVTMATIARNLSIKPPSLYNHFDGLDDIKNGMSVSALNQFFNWLSEKTEHQTEGRETILALTEAYITFALQHPGLYEATLMAANPLQSDVQEAGEAIVTLTMKAFEPYHLSEVERIHIVRGLRSNLHGMVDLYHKGGFQLPISLEESYRMIVETYLSGVVNRRTLEGETILKRRRP